MRIGQVTPGSRWRERRRGIAVVEFALIAPFLTFLALGMIEIGRALMVKQYLADAARIGCRTAAKPGGTTTSVTSDVNGVLGDNGINTTYVTVTVTVNGTVADASTAVSGDKIAVKVSITASRIAWITSIFMPGSNIESETTVMMRQG